MRGDIKISELTICGDLLQAGGIFNLDGGGLWVGGDIQVGIDAIFVAAGTITGDVNTAGIFNAEPAGGVSTLALTGNFTQTGGTALVTTAPFSISGAFLQAGGDDTVQGAGYSTGGALGVAGTYEQDGGTMTVADSNSQLTTGGLLNLQGGTFTLDGGDLTADGGTYVAPAATLIAAGVIHGDLATAGTFAAQPGGGGLILALALSHPHFQLTKRRRRLLPQGRGWTSAVAPRLLGPCGGGTARTHAAGRPGRARVPAHRPARRRRGADGAGRPAHGGGGAVPG